MYEQSFNGLIGHPSTLISGSSSQFYLTNPTFQPVRSHPTAIHRCISTPFLGKDFNSTNSSHDFAPTLVQNHSHHYYLHEQRDMNHFLQHPNASQYAGTIPDTKSGMNGSAAVKKEIIWPENDQDYSEQPVFGKYVYKREKGAEGIAKNFMECDCHNRKGQIREIMFQLDLAEEKIEQLEQKAKEKEGDKRKLQKMISDKYTYVLQMQEQKIVELTKLLEAYKSKGLKNGRLELEEKRDSRDLLAENQHLTRIMKQMKDDFDRDMTSRKRLHHEITELEGQLKNEKDYVVALTEEIKVKQKKIETLKAQFTECSAQRQSLLEDKKGLEDKLKSCKEIIAGFQGSKSLQKQLLREMVSTVSRMKNLAEFFIKDHGGEDMSVSLIIGSRATPVAHSSHQKFSNVNEMLSYQVQEVGKIKDEITKLQENLSTDYAINIGRHLSL